jgi:hypothetical protein
MGIKQNYLYRVLPSLVQEGRLIKDGRGESTKPSPSGLSQAWSSFARVPGTYPKLEFSSAG